MRVIRYTANFYVFVQNLKIQKCTEFMLDTKVYKISKVEYFL